VVISALNRKLLRDVRGMLGQATAIALVVASGVAMYVMYLANFDSLRRSQRAYYQQQAFADVFVSLKRAPNRLAEPIGRIPGVVALETRVGTNVRLDITGFEESVMGRLVSIPEDRRPRLNDLFLRRGRWIERDRPDEVIASEGFVEAHGFEPGDAVTAIVNGRRRRLTIVGVALSPEYVYSIRPGELVPDDRRFGIFWMGEQALAGLLDMAGTFNDVTLSVAAGASSADIVARLDRLLDPYGGLGAMPRSLQLSHWTLENELSQLQRFGFLLPLLFLSVAGFTLNVALGRAMALQRAQIATLKAVGYTNLAIGWHYMKWALLVAGSGVAIGLYPHCRPGGRLTGDGQRKAVDLAVDATASADSTAAASTGGRAARAHRARSRRPGGTPRTPPCPARPRRCRRGHGARGRGGPSAASRK
jgi:putative ABC transport system permease protein